MAGLMALFGLRLSAQQVRIFQENGAWQLQVNQKPFYIQGAVGNSYPEKLAAYGGNSMRTGADSTRLDHLANLGLYALVNLPVKPQRDGMDYDDARAVEQQKVHILNIVRQTKDNPAILMWAVGNELDFIPHDTAYNLKVWDAVNQIARAIHRIDPNHPVMTVIGTGRMDKVEEIKKRCPDIDLLGINAYRSIYSIAKQLSRYGWDRPYVITEWGPDGYWEVPTTPWHAPYEQTGLEKYLSYKNKYRKAILSQQGKCLGSYVFYWATFKQETTHTWFCLFDRQGRESAMVGLMQQFWSHTTPTNQAPLVDSLNIAGHVRYQPIYLSASKRYSAWVTATDPDNDSLNYRWEIRPEAVYAAYAGQGEQVPRPIAGLISPGQATISFMAPRRPGAYRLFVYAYDGHGHFSTANLPFLTQ
jgi:hypothetical protein